MRDAETLIQEENAISLRTVLVLDNGNLVSFSLMPADLESLAPKGRTWWAPKDFEWVSRDRTYLYRHARSGAGEAELMRGFPCVDQDIKPMSFSDHPKFKLQWSDSGHSVALYLNGEPWAFIDEKSHQGYSKGILRPAHSPPVGNQWNQSLFEATFGD